MRYLGIDCGLAGAVAVVDTNGVALSLGTLAPTYNAWDTPTIGVTTGPTKTRRHREYVIPEMQAILLRATFLDDGKRDTRAVIEYVSPMPKEGVVSACRMGLGFGIWQALLVALGIPYRIVHPSVWKKAMGLQGRDKNYSRLVASQRFPGVDLGRVKDHGRAEALLMASYAQSLQW